YLERSITSAPAGIDALPLATLCTRSSSTMTTALVKTRPVPATNLPNLMALVAARAVEDVAKKNRTTSSLALRMGPPEIGAVGAKVSSENRHCQAMNNDQVRYLGTSGPSMARRSTRPWERRHLLSTDWGMTDSRKDEIFFRR